MTKIRIFLLLLCLVAGQSFGQQAPDSMLSEAELLTVWETKQYPKLDAYLSAFVEPSSRDVMINRRLYQAIVLLTRRKPTVSAPFDEWIAATNSGVSHLARATFYRERAWNARGEKFVNETHTDAFNRMHALLADAKSDYQIAIDKLGPNCDLCYAGLINAWMLEGDRKHIANLLDAALRAMNGGISTPMSYADTLLPQWGGSATEMERFPHDYIKNYPASPAGMMLKSNLVEWRAKNLHHEGKLTEAMELYTLATQLNPENTSAWSGMTSLAIKVGNDQVAFNAADIVLLLSPKNVGALTAKAHVVLKGTTPLDAMPLLERAVAEGSDWALEVLLPIVAAGRYGFPPDRQRAERICQSAIDADMAAGYACMGGIHYFGVGRAVDKPKALTWFVEASNRGFVRATMDAALMLSKGDGIPLDMDRAIGLWAKAKTAGEASAENFLKQNLSFFGYWKRVQLPEFTEWSIKLLKENVGVRRAIISAISTTLVLLIGSLLYKAGDKPAHRFGSMRLLKSGRWLRVLSLAYLSICILGSAGLYHLAPHEVNGWVLLGLAVLMTLALWLAYSVYFTHVSFSDRSLYFDSPISGRKKIRFSEIREIGWSYFRHSSYVESLTGERIYISQMLEGYEELSERLRADWEDNK